MPYLENLGRTATSPHHPIYCVVGRMLFPNSDEEYHECLDSWQLVELHKLRRVIDFILECFADKSNSLSSDFDITEFQFQLEALLGKAIRDYENATGDITASKVEGMKAKAPTLVGRGCIAGEILLTSLMLKKSDHPFGLGLSRNVARKIIKRQKTYSANATKIRSVEEAWISHRNVAHLWAAHLYYERLPLEEVPEPKPLIIESKKGPDYRWKLDPPTRHTQPINFVDNLPTWHNDSNFQNFLRIAQWFYNEGIGTRWKQAEYTMLDPSDCWRIPKDNARPIDTLTLNPPDDLDELVKQCR